MANIDGKKEVVAVIGAGISGLLACKYAISKGFDPIVFESESSIGGVWTKTIGSTKLQTPKADYQFSDFPWPDYVTEMFPHQQTVLEYIQSYASHFDLLRHIQFNTKVLSLNYEDSISGEFSNKGKWNIIVQDTRTISTETQIYKVDFVVVCVGRFSQVPDIPKFPPNKGPEVFEGEVIHSMDYSKMEPKMAANFVKGKHVSVVGFQKSGMDIAMECSTVNGLEYPCNVLIRTPWGLYIGYLYQNRFSELMVHKPGEGLLLSLIATTLSPLRWAFSKFIESYIKHKHRLAKHGMVPEHSFLNAMSSCSVCLVPEQFYDRVEEGSIKLIKQVKSFGFSKEGIVFEGQAEPIKSDLVILATGFNGIDKLKHIFESPKYQELIAGDSASIPLYRECIHPRIPQLAIIGFSKSDNNLHSSEVRCRWLAELLDEKFKLPSVEEMEKDIAEWDTYKKRYSSLKYYTRSCIGALHIWHCDQLCKDMGWNPKRKNNFWAEWFEPYGPMDYTG